MGAATACELAREGASVALIDQSSLPNPQAASFDHSKVFRFAYPDPFYVSLAVDALKRWQALEDETATKLLTQSGALLIGKRRPSFETQCYDALRSLNLEAEMLDAEEIAVRFPQFNAEAFSYGVLDPSGAILYASKAVRALIALAKKHRVTIIEGERVNSVEQASLSTVLIVGDSNKIRCEQAMIASGPWTRKLVPFLADKLTTTFQETVYFEPIERASPSESSPGISFEAGSLPIFLELDSGFYGMPIHQFGAMKIANHYKGTEIDPYTALPVVSEAFIESCRAFFGAFIPELADARVIETRVCVYNNTPDDDFIIDWHPDIESVLVVTGFSGHGFKFGPTIGRIASDLLRSRHTARDWQRFSLARF